VEVAVVVEEAVQRAVVVVALAGLSISLKNLLLPTQFIQ
jgi:hypothetical protein